MAEEPALSVLLPVHDVENTLLGTVMEILDLLPELTPRFEVIVVDDGSADDTVALADELAARYPQVKVISHPRPLGREAAIQTGLAASRGDVIFLRDEDSKLMLGEIHKLWQAMEEHQRVLGRAAVRRWSSWMGWRRRKYEGGFRMIRRDALGSTSEKNPGSQTALTEGPLDRTRGWHEVEVHERAPRQPSRLTSARAHHVPVGRSHQNAYVEWPRPLPGKPKRPNYLLKLKDFALGE